MTTTAMTTKRLAPGLYEIRVGTRTYSVERYAGQFAAERNSLIWGWWYAETPGGKDVLEAPTLRDVKHDIAIIEGVN